MMATQAAISHSPVAKVYNFFMCALRKLELILYVLCMLINGIFVILHSEVSGSLEESSLTLDYALHILKVPC